MVKIPAPEQLREISASYDLDLSDADVGSFLGLIESVMASYDRIDQLAEPAPAEPSVKYPRSGGRRPEPEENPLGAWYYRCSIRGAPEGPSWARGSP
jgi:amidase